ncbi:DNA binding domain-containing protein, excisionase family, partial [Abditibacterium utsteinense]
MTRDTNATNDATRDTTKGDLSRDMTRQGVAISEAAKILGVSLRTVQRRLDKGELRSIERDGKRFVLLDSNATERDTVSRQLSQRDATQEQNSATNDATEAKPKPLDWEK